MSAAEIQRVALVPACFTEAAAQDIVRRHHAALPDLRHLVVLIPDPHAAPDVARALRTAAAQPVLLLPRVLTLRQWAGEMPLDKPVASRAVREAVLYGALGGQRSLGDADRWAVASELLALFDELTRHTVALPQSAEDFARQLERAYRARKNRSFEFEATLVHELWHLMARDASELDPEAAFQLRLARLASGASLPLYVLGPRRVAPAEQQFYGAYAQRASLVVFEPAADTADDVGAVLSAAWPTTPKAGLHARALALKAAAPVSVLAQRLSIFDATSPEQEARAVDIQVRHWLLSGRQRIAVVAFDRVTARRARALLERAGVLVRDEAGWPMATTSAATVVSRWLDVTSGDAWHRDLLDLMKSPFSFYDWPRDVRQHTVWRLEQYIREANITAGIGNYIELAEQHNDAEVRQLLVRMQRGMHALGRTRRPVARWLQALLDSLTEIGVGEGLAADSAGSQVIDLIEFLINDLSRDTLAVPFAEWRRWLARQLETASFIERKVESPVVFTHLAATALRAFDAVLVLGCDARHLSGASDAPMFFNQSVRAQLGLPTRHEETQETEALLAQLIASTPTVLLTWQKMSGGELNLRAPPVERLLALHRSAYGDALEAKALAAWVAQTELRCAETLLPMALTSPAAPAAATTLLPDRISASGYNTLLACPYQYHARYLLRLAPLDDVQELIEKSDYGQHVHHVLQTFHAAHATVGYLPEGAAVAELERLSDEAFATDIARNYLARGWLLRWKGLIPDYVDWQRSREAEGWRWYAGEASRQIAITTPQGRTLTLLGRIDRVDVNAGAVAVLDYKTGSAKSLEDKLKSPGEDVQLPVYALLWGGPVAAALFLSIERDGVTAVPIDEDLAMLAQSARERLGDLYDAMSAGQPMPAQGASKACEYLRNARPVSAGTLVMADLHALNRTALDPARSVVVSACAGSGKTWLLVSRIVRALLDGTQPSEILAITFTRKAAQEMAERLREWLRALATADDAKVQAMLKEREVPAERIAGLIPVARQLYERFLTAEPGITITTFHSWFLQLLRRAPLDADALGNVNLLEETAALLDEAWERFALTAQREPQGAVAHSLDYLFTHYGIDSTRKVLTNFLYRRADWWAYGDDQSGADAIGRALSQLAAAMDCAPDDDVLGALFADEGLWQQLEAFAKLLGRNTDKDKRLADRIVSAREMGDPHARFELVHPALLTQNHELLKRKSSGAQIKRLGADDEARFLSLHEHIGQRLQRALQSIACQKNYRFNEAALQCGHALLEEYQSLKRDRRVIDYADIEWRIYRLLCESDHAIYMLCKLDSRYRHVLLDEFQDTNPLQWLTLQRWFESASEVDSRPQVFVVGDPKQSIYRFRRAEARLFDQAIEYLGHHFGAPMLPNDESRRCAPVVIEVVNRVFSAQGDYKGFRPHTAHYRNKPGRVEVLPLIEKDAREESAADGGLRNPFAMPLTTPEDSRRAREAAQLAQRITTIKRDWWIAADDPGELGRRASYRDIMILVSRRTHLEIYERALREAHIPFVTSRQGGLLDTLEVQDMIALLAFLVSPFDDLKLAHALRSPVFSCSDDDLVAIAQSVRTVPDGTWWQALERIAADASDALARAHRLLAQWLARADMLPVHDQLDRIYFEADVLHRYDAAVPSAMRGAVAANLHAFMQRALDTDAGRYPSLPRFIAELADLRSAPAVESPDEGVVGDASDAVHIHTVHGAKGLEAPIVWLLDAASGGNNHGGYETLLDWSAGEPRPNHFSVWSRKDEQSPLQREILDREKALAAREDLNLLYVAMTRAKQALIVSGCESSGRSNSWYEKIAAALNNASASDTQVPRVMGDVFDEKNYVKKQIVTDISPECYVVDPRLSQPLPTGVRRVPLDGRGLRYGTQFHALMERLTQLPLPSRADLQRLSGLPEAAFEPLWNDAQRVLSAAEYQRYFAVGAYRGASNEVPFATASGENLRIDRLVEFVDEVCVLDYKTGTLSGTDSRLLAEYRAQVCAYCVHMARAFPAKRVHGLIIFAGGGNVAVTASA